MGKTDLSAVSGNILLSWRSKSLWGFQSLILLLFLSLYHFGSQSTLLSLKCSISNTKSCDCYRIQWMKLCGSCLTFRDNKTITMVPPGHRNILLLLWYRTPDSGWNSQPEEHLHSHRNTRMHFKIPSFTFSSGLHCVHLGSKVVGLVQYVSSELCTNTESFCNFYSMFTVH